MRRVGVVIAGLVLAGLLGACGGGIPQAADEPVGVPGEAFQMWHFEDLPTMAATAPIIVLGTVDGPGQKGRLADPEQNRKDPLSLREVPLRVEQVFKGNVREGDRLNLIEYGYRGDVPFAMEGTPWSKEGDRGVFFLIQTGGQEGTNDYSQISPEGRLVLVGDEVISHGENDFAREVEGRASSEVPGLVEAAVEESVARGIPAQKPWQERHADAYRAMEEQRRQGMNASTAD